MKTIILLISVISFPNLVWANTSSWQCNNSINEIKCKNKVCNSGAILDSTFQVSIQNNSKITVCTQNKCWNGQAISKNKEHQSLYSIKHLGWTAQNQPNSNYTLGINNKTNSLYLQDDHKAIPLQCQIT